MQLTLYRETCNRLYTEGSLAVNDRKIIRTVEATEIMLPRGTYEVKLMQNKSRRREITILNTPSVLVSSSNPSLTSHPSPKKWTIGVAHSWIGSKKEHCICIGQFLIPGALYKGTEPYERLYDRIEKCQDRKEPILLTITEGHMVNNQPIKHWTTVY